ncbi:ribonuclease E/G [Butyrivibrio sp. JL13D10]|uniref:ribonuclease E/G n=1 Tax=Butyrivibrio sp. JL13D10 TaxID=3236815 RepID=UPI0038B5E2BB
MCEVIITNWHEHLTLIGFKDNKVQMLDVLDQDDRTGNIYVGRVENLLTNLNAAFVRFQKDGGKHGIGFLPLRALDPKLILNRVVGSPDELKAGDIVLVQVSVEEMKTKQARLTGRIDIEKSDFNGDMEQLISVARTRTEYQRISNESVSTALYIKNICDNLKIITDDKHLKIITDVTSVYNELIENKCFFEEVSIEYYDEEEKRLPLSVCYSLISKTEDLFKKKVWLDSGAFLVIEQTETLNLIDVNSGKALKKSEDFFLQLNMEAAREAYRQIRLRNLSGMILIDFVSLKKADSNEKLISYIKNLIRNDPMHLSLIDMTKLGIIEFTRDKSKKSLRETIDIRKM